MVLHFLVLLSIWVLGLVILGPYVHLPEELWQQVCVTAIDKWYMYEIKEGYYYISYIVVCTA